MTNAAMKRKPILCEKFLKIYFAKPASHDGSLGAKERK
jgi:hypothetical protein